MTTAIGPARLLPATPRGHAGERRHTPVPRAVAPVAIGLAGFAISEIGNRVPSVWYDEVATVTSATRSWGQLWAEIHSVDAVHAAYYSLMHLVFSVFGYSPFTLRLPSAIAVGLTAALVIVLVRSLGQPRLAVIAGALYCLIPRVTWMGGEGRSYALSALLAVVVTLALLRALRASRRLPWVAYAALVVMSCTVFIYLALVVVAHAVTVLSLRRDAGRALLRWLTAAVVAGIVLLPFVLLLRGQQGQVTWIQPISLATFGQVFVTQWFWGTALLPIVAWLLIAFAGFDMVRRWAPLSLGSIVLPALVLPTVLLIGVSIVHSPLYSPRYLAMCAPFVAIAMAAAVDRLRGPRALRIGGLAATFVVIAALAVPHIVLAQRVPDAKQDSTWSSVAALISRERTADTGRVGLTGTAIIYGPVRYHPTATTRVISIAYPAAFVGTTDVTLAIPGAERGTLWETHHPLEQSLERLADSHTVYLITSVKQDRRPSTTALLSSLGWSKTRQWHFTDVTVVRYDLSARIGS
jgi:mannosyltransferase